ncbi:hypothetical protein EGW08_007891, partial [Elysia chlorotica]
MADCPRVISPRTGRGQLDHVTIVLFQLGLALAAFPIIVSGTTTDSVAFLDEATRYLGEDTRDFDEETRDFGERIDAFRQSSDMSTSGVLVIVLGLFAGSSLLIMAAGLFYLARWRTLKRKQDKALQAMPNDQTPDTDEELPGVYQSCGSLDMWTVESGCISLYELDVESGRVAPSGHH